MTVRALIADDEPLARSGLRDLLAAHEWVTVVGEAAHGPAAVEAVDRLQPELLFLDIQMPGLSGIDVLRRATHQPFVLFTTAFAEHAVTAFELGALDYLLKPFGATRLAAAMTRVRAALGEPALIPAHDRLGDALSQGPMTRLFVRTGNAITPVLVDTVHWFEADGDYVVAQTGSARHLVHVALSKLEARLDPTRFERIHRTHVINLAQLRAYRRVAGKLVAELLDGTRLPVSRAKAQEIRARGV